MHAPQPEAPEVAVYVPFSQSTQLVEPELFWLVPDAQLEHALDPDDDE